MFEKIITRVLNEGELIRKEPIGTIAFSLTIRCKKISEFDYKPGQFIRVYVGSKSNVSGKDNIRTYSVWELNKAEKTIRLGACFLTEGPGSKWVKEIEVGEKVHFSKPKGKFTLDTSFESYIFIGDTSALAHLYELQRNLPSEKKIDGFIYANKKDDLFEDVDNTTPFSFCQVDTNPMPEIYKFLEGKIEKDDSKVIYIGGDGRICVELNKYLKQEMKWDKKSIKTKPFWMPNKKGLE